jgi:hypothetical protein
MNNIELAEIIRQRFIPLAFTCDCSGSHADCASVLDNPVAWSQHDTALRIAKFIESQDS